MALHYSRDGYTFFADAARLNIEPGPDPITLDRTELEGLGLSIRDDFRMPATEAQEDRPVIAGILSALSLALRRCEGAQYAALRRDLRRAMSLIGDLDEKRAQEILSAGTTP